MPLAEPPVLLVHDELTPCPYLPGRVARMPMLYPIRKLSPDEVDARLSWGYRRQGALLYNMQCPDCSACEPIRLSPATFKPSKTQRRILRRGRAAFSVELGEPDLTVEKLALYHQHKHGRGLAHNEVPMSPEGYRSFLVERSCDAFEIRYRTQSGALAAVAVTDRGARSLSAVYTYFDPDLSPLSPGVFSILTQLSLCETWGLEHLYLGLFIAESRHMRYKGAYVPHERLVDGKWQRATDLPRPLRDSDGCTAVPLSPSAALLP